MTIRILTLMMLLAGPAAEADGVLPESLDGFVARYQVRWGPLSGSVTMLMETDSKPGVYKYSVISKARGLAGLFRRSPAAEHTLFRLRGERPVPLEYSRDDGSGKAKGLSSVSFDWSACVASSIHEGEPAEVALEAGVHDRLTADIAAMLDLRDGRELESYQLVDRNTIRTYEFRRMDTETIETRAGSFEAVKFHRQRKGSTRSVLIWFAPALGYLPVRVEQQKNGETSVTMVLDRVPSPSPAAG